MSLNYVMLGSNNVEKACTFYDAVFPVISGKRVADYLPHAVCYQFRDGGRVWVASPFDEQSATPGNGNMVGFACQSVDEVKAAHKAAMSQGGANEGDPGPRPLYGPDFFGAYVRDLDGNKMSFVFLGDG